MRIGIFSNINGDYDKLKNSVDELVSRDVEGVFCLGNLISRFDFVNTYNQIDALLGIDEKSLEFRLDDASKKCIDYIRIGIGSDVKSVFLFKGQNEDEFIKHIFKIGKNQDPYAKSISDYLSFIIDSNFALCGGSFRAESSSEGHLEKTLNLFNQLKHLNKNLNLVFSGQLDNQGVYIIDKFESFYSAKNKILIKNDGNNYVVYPSSERGGYAVFDFKGPKEVSEVSLFR